MDLRIENLSKTYPNGVKALDNVSLTIPCGMYGLLGPNGAGKSTLMRTLATLQEADTGTVRLGEIDGLKQKDEVRRHLGYLPQDFGVYPRISAQDMLNHIALLKGIANNKERKELVEAVLRRCNLFDVRKKALASFSGGMRQRVSIARALINQPPIVLYDSPTAGLDPVTSQTIITLILRLRDVFGVTALLATQRLQDGFALANFRFDAASKRVVHSVSNGNAEGAAKMAATRFLVLRDGGVYFEGGQGELADTKDEYLKRFLV